MTTATPSSRGARRRNNGRRPGADRPVRTPETSFATPAPAYVNSEPVAPIDYVTDFVTLGVPAPLIAVLAARDVVTAFPIQSATLPDSLLGYDVLGRGKTGSGKTIAFALPLVAGLVASGRRARPGHPRAVVLLPTRELATQVHEAIAPVFLPALWRTRAL